jgi:hypothetical protein
MKVAQGNGLPVDVVGMRLDDVVKIKGPKGTGSSSYREKSGWDN